MSNNNQSLGIFKAIGQVLSALVRVVTTTADGVEEYAKVIKTSGEMANAAILNAKEEQTLELEETKAKRLEAKSARSRAKQ